MSEAKEQSIREIARKHIAVTVDMIATGTDIRPLECLLFFRDVRSRVYFEQMKGRGTRVLSPTDLQAVSGAEATAKTHFVIIDAVGVCESDKTESRPLERKPSVRFDKLLLGVALGKRDEDTLTTLAGRLARLDRALSPADRKTIEEVSGGSSLSTLSATLLRAIDPDAAAEAATGKPGANPDDVDAALFQEARQKLIVQACSPFDNPALRDTLANLKKDNEQTIDVVTIDNLVDYGFDAAARERLRAWSNEIENDETEPIYPIDPIEEIRELLGVAAATAIDYGISQEKFMGILFVEWESSERHAEIDKQVEKEWNAKPEAEKKRIEDGLRGILGG